VEIKLPDAFFTPDSRSGFQPSDFSEEVLQGKTNVLFPPGAGNAENGVLMDEEDYGILVALMDQTAELLSRFDREMKYEVLEDSGMLLIQVIDTTDGRVVRKISADEVIKLVSQIRDEMSEKLGINV
jgi:hypothetical protein